MVNITGAYIEVVRPNKLRGLNTQPVRDLAY
jgi:hypothetical protein